MPRPASAEEVMGLLPSTGDAVGEGALLVLPPALRRRSLMLSMSLANSSGEVALQTEWLANRVRRSLRRRRLQKTQIEAREMS